MTVVSSAAAGGVRVVVRRAAARRRRGTGRCRRRRAASTFSSPTAAGPRSRATAATRRRLAPAAARRVCTPGEKTTCGTEEVLEFGYTCTDEPVARHAAPRRRHRRAVSNAACRCRPTTAGSVLPPSWFWTDKENDGDIPPQVDRYWLKWRYYFQEYVPAAPSAPASHRGLHHRVFPIDAVNDYEDAVAYGTPSVGKIRARLTARQLGLEDTRQPAPCRSMTPQCTRRRASARSSGTPTRTRCCATSPPSTATPATAARRAVQRARPRRDPAVPLWPPAGLPKPWTLTPDANLTALVLHRGATRGDGAGTGLMVYDTLDSREGM